MVQRKTARPVVAAIPWLPRSFDCWAQCAVRMTNGPMGNLSAAFV